MATTAHLVVDAVEVGAEALVEPPAGVADFGADVARVGRAEGPSVVVPGQRVLHRPAEPGHMQPVAVLLALYPAAATSV